MSLKIENTIIAKSPARPGAKLGAFLGVTIHETGNQSPTAGANNHAVYMNGSGKQQQVSYHYVVDELSAYHLVPDSEVAWHAGDGAKGEGNNRTLAIEICVNSKSDTKQRRRAVQNAAELAAKLLAERGITACSGHLFQHHDFSPYGKNCPADIRAGKPIDWTEFCRLVDEYLAPAADNELTNEKEPAANSLYRVQVGAFASRENAEKYAGELKGKGLSAFVREG